ncbi:hypothetical protein [Nocardia sp. R7R-8]|uniref:hypothetical protein n=1 Tax=Nocardia sp. R7R-8 TaxID=3459304 RepID=UPI00403DC3C9
MIRQIGVAAAAAALTALTATGSAQAAPRTWLNDGTQVVGEDVLPGLYSTTGPNSNDYGYCFITWLPYKGARSSQAVDMESYSGPSYVTLRDGDVVIVDGCTWIHETYRP